MYVFMLELVCMQYELNPILYTTCTFISALNLQCIYILNKDKMSLLIFFLILMKFRI